MDKLEYDVSRYIDDYFEKPFIRVDMKLNGGMVKWNNGVSVWSVLYHSFEHRPMWGGELCSWSAFYPFTCSCGDAGCAGIWSGIKVKVRRNTVEWRIEKGHGYDKFMGKTFYSFDRKQYEKAYSNFVHWLEQHSYDVDDGHTQIDEYSIAEGVVEEWRDKINAENALSQKSSFGGMFRRTKR